LETFEFVLGFGLRVMVLSFDLIAPLIIGFVGSFHCLGMCGPLVMAYSLHMGLPREEKAIDPPAPWVRGIFHHGAFHLGRLVTYGLLGGLAGGSPIWLNSNNSFPACAVL
jgi:sulfite exporter TauE/SafE